MNVIKITALKTNYIWIIYNSNNECIVIDPGESEKVLKVLKKLKLILKSILLTHYHHDHTYGVYNLIKYFPKTLVYGPIETKNQKINIIVVSEGDNISLLNKKIKVFNFPGHTLHHIGFYCNPWLFSGDTIFSAGCGKVQSGLIQKMYKSFLKIKNFPKKTFICSGHEYTLENINFALSILPTDQSIIQYRKKIINLYKKQIPIIPTTLELELKINLFFRYNNIDIKKSLGFPNNTQEEWEIFRKLRNKKDSYNAKN